MLGRTNISDEESEQVCVCCFWCRASSFFANYSNLIQLWVSFTHDLSIQYVEWSLSKGIWLERCIKNFEGEVKVLATLVTLQMGS